MDEDRRRRAAALEEKRKRLEELKKKKAEREQKDTAAGATAATGADAPADTSSTDQFNDYVNSLLSAPAPVPTSPPASATATAEAPKDSGPAVAKEGGELSADDVAVILKPPVVLSLARGLGKVHILPTATEYYHKGCQTDAPTPPEDPSSADHLLSNTVSPSLLSSSQRRRPSRHNSTLTQGDELNLALTQTMNAEAKGGEPSSSQAVEEVAAVKKKLSEPEKEAVVKDGGFQAFLSRSSLLVERVLGRDETYNVFVDYSSRDGADRKRGDGSDAITPLVQFHVEGLTRDRPIMDVQWSPHYSELLLAAYNTQAARGDQDLHLQQQQQWSQPHPGGGGSSDGLVLLWSLAMQNRPEFRFECQSPVLTARFHDHDSHVVLGGTYSGQVVLWDTRAKSLPVQRTPLSTSGHTHPVYSMSMTGAASSPCLVTASSDGRVCFWNLAKLDRPESTVELAYEPAATSPRSPMSPNVASPPIMSTARKAGGGPISISAFALNNDKGVEELILGSESGHLYVTQLQNRKAVGVRQHDAHFGLVTSLHRHPSPSKQLSSLFLSASVDWSLRLWDFKRSPEALAVFQHGLYDYVSDARWCPVHAAVFGSVTSGGDLYVWNLNHSLESPVAKCSPLAASSSASPSAPAGTAGEALASSSLTSKCALTKLAWSTEGRKMAVGDAKGQLHVLGLADELVKARMDEDLRLETLLQHGGAQALTTSGGGGKGGSSRQPLHLAQQAGEAEAAEAFA